MNKHRFIFTYLIYGLITANFDVHTNKLSKIMSYFRATIEKSHGQRLLQYLVQD